MCGRFSLDATAETLATLFDLEPPQALAPRYNIAPTQPVLALRVAPGTDRRGWAWLRWGLIPAWAKDPGIGARMINARSETVAEKPAFRAAFRRRRCLVPATGFYEWRGESGRKQPYLIHAPDGAPFAIAGLWEHWQDPGGAELETCTLLTTEANEALRPLHDRMPVLLAPEAWERWLDPALEAPDPLLPLLAPAPPERLVFHAVSDRVNRVQNDDPELIVPLPALS